MSIPWIGFLLIPVGLLSAVLAPRLLFALVLVATPFTATAVVNSQSGASLFAVQFLGSCWIARSGLDWLVHRRYVSVRLEHISIGLLWLFVLAVLLSMLTPYQVAGADWAIHGDGGIGKDDIAEWVPIELTWSTVKYPLPILFGALLASTLAIKIRTLKNLHLAVKLSIASVCFFAVWGLLQYVFENILHVAYPFWIFNTASGESTQGYLQKSESGLTRICSAALEPSIFVKQILVILPILWFVILTKNKLFGRTLDVVILLTLLLSIFLSASTTAFVGVAIFLLVVLWFSNVAGLLNLRSLGTVFSLTAIVSVIAIAVIFFTSSELVNEILWNKAESGSFISRLFSVGNAWSYFLKYPILGAGWSFITSHDLFVYLLANAGLIGFATFLFMSLQPLIRAVNLLKSYKNQNKIYTRLPAYVCALASSQVLFIVLGIVTGYDFYLAYAFVTMGLLYASNALLGSELHKGVNL